jgi:hypothetical protein
MAEQDSPRHPPAEGRDHTEEPVRTPAGAEAGRRDPAAEPGTGEGGRETTGRPRHPAPAKRPRPK